MNLILFAKLYAVALPVFFLIDMLWLGVVARGFYASQLGSLLSPTVNWVAAIIFYTIFVAGLVFFALAPAVEKQSLLAAAGLGALFGFMCYATYDLTNLSTLRGWPLLMSIVDMAWGAALGALVCTLSYLAATRLFSFV